MLGAAVPRGTGQKKGVFEGLPGLVGPPEMLEGGEGSKAHIEEPLLTVSPESFRVTQDIRLTVGNSNETSWTSNSQTCILKKLTKQNYLKEERSSENLVT